MSTSRCLQAWRGPMPPSQGLCPPPFLGTRGTLHRELWGRWPSGSGGPVPPDWLRLPGRSSLLGHGEHGHCPLSLWRTVTGLNDVMALGVVPIVMVMVAGGGGAPFQAPPVPSPGCLVTSGQSASVTPVRPLPGTCEHTCADRQMCTPEGWPSCARERQPHRAPPELGGLLVSAGTRGDPRLHALTEGRSELSRD